MFLNGSVSFFQKDRLGDKMQGNNNVIKLTEKEKKIIELLRSLDYGEIRIVITDSKPLIVEEMKKSIKL